MQLLLVDNYDSFTFNLAQALRSTGAKVVVRPNDVVDPSRGALAEFDGIVLSPGPGRPTRGSDVGRCREILRSMAEDQPLLGVCLGHQMMALAEGARLVRAGRVMHGKTSRLVHDGADLFSTIPPGCGVMRYHSWAIDAGSLPTSLRPTAWADDGTLMAVAHRERPWWGLQFHPESVGTPDGPAILARFVARVQERRARRPSTVLRTVR